MFVNFLRVDDLGPVFIMTRSCTIVVDIIALTVTWARTYKLAYGADQVKVPLTSFLLQYGTLHFTLSLILNVVFVAFWFAEPNINLPYFETALSNITVSRFLLTIRQVNHRDENGSNSTRPSFALSPQSDRRIASRFVESMGETLGLSLCFAEDEEVADDEEYD
ncbi:hypothetical protein BKA93DRAFT_829844 [Sparassis latifolia]